MFSSKSIQEPTSNEWIMNTGAIDHVHTNEGILETLSHNRNYHSILVGNGFLVSVTKIRRSFSF